MAEITGAGGKAIAVGASVAKEDDIESLFAETRRTFGKVDILVNNAGVYGFAPLEQITADEYKRQYDTNVFGLLLTTKAALPHFPEQGGSVINISSVVSTLAPAAASVYASTKGAVNTITETLAKELAQRNIRSQCHQPWLGHHGGNPFGWNRRQRLRAECDRCHSTRSRRAAGDIAPPVFLASDDARWITGETIFVSGGAAM